MIPIRDRSSPHGVAMVTYLLIVINTVVFVLMLLRPQPELFQFIQAYALVPNEIVQGQNLYTLVTAIFIHGGFIHIIGNMLALKIFGDSLENELGSIKFLVFYLLSGFVASFVQIIIEPGSEIPVLGASGAIAGVMGGYLMLFPRHKIDAILPIGFLFFKITIPAQAMLIYWITIQVFSGIGQLNFPGTGGVAYLAHVGGFLFGLIFIRLFRNKS